MTTVVYYGFEFATLLCSIFVTIIFLPLFRVTTGLVILLDYMSWYPMITNYRINL